jgi:hypothetical protein
MGAFLGVAFNSLSTAQAYTSLQVRFALVTAVRVASCWLALRLC